MLPLSKREAIAKHTNTLPLDQLAQTASCLLKPEFGLFNVILPSAIFHRFISKAEQYGLYLTCITRVMTSPQRPCKRVLLCFKNSKNVPTMLPSTICRFLATSLMGEVKNMNYSLKIFIYNP